MDTTAFFTQLQHAFPGNPQDTDPVDPRWARIAQDVAGFTGPNELAVLNVAAAVLPQDEAYLEVGTFKGRSLCAAVQDNGSKDFFVMENFMEFGMAGQEARAELEDNLSRHAGDASVRLLEGDCFKLMAQSGTVTKPVGVYFYDGEHTVLSHYLALAVAEPLLADEALVLVDDASWPVVQRAHRLFMRRHPGWTIAQTWNSGRADDPRWSNGLQALVFRRTTGRSELSTGDQMLRQYQAHLQHRLNAAIWKAAGVFPAPFKAVEKVVRSRSHTIRGD
ncbi:class I SAM-dependent methyltransferase [Allobranchiibius sp. GilTou73]|uniref:class I SAM-dependent methyltransferase n=1 Tax=Allobranchiibius sp. GilTou73 TaxID=2904523 RepID=UPI001F317324|nr:class I SAM-dependent methyltransferase [Allobranchiibius sp. GilTou73]UIJ33823.1 class I SAM-dependent methyltransferase [Allobranchiibius sp. GilTou73]